MNTELQFDSRSIHLTDAQLRGVIRQKLLAGNLRETLAHAVFGGISAGGSCDACDGSIGIGKVEIGTYGADRTQRHYHPKCHLALSVELEDFAQC
jgi:hypothetical protein